MSFANIEEAIEDIRQGRMVIVVDDEDPSKMGAGSDMVNAETRMAHVEALRPDIATLDCGSINFSDDKTVGCCAAPDKPRQLLISLVWLVCIRRA